MHSRRWNYSWLALGAVASIVGCSRNNTGLPPPVVVQSRAALQSFSGPNACAELEAHLEDVAVLEMKSYIDSMKNRGGGFFWGPIADSPMASAKGNESSSVAAAPQEYTTTNTQVAGVDEADFVKNDGTRIFVLSGGKLYTTLSWPASALALQGQLDIEGWPLEMFLDDQNRVVVFSQIYRQEWYGVYDVRSAGSTAKECAGDSCGYAAPNAVKVTVVDVSQLSKPTVQREVYFPGYYSNARRVGDSVRLVLSGYVQYPSQLSYWPEITDSNIYDDSARWNAELDKLAVTNEQLIRQQTLDDWLPVWAEKQADGTWKNGTRDCSKFSKNTAPTQLGVLTLATLNLANPTVVDQTNIIAQVGEVYASEKNLYVTNYHWWWLTQPGQKDATYIHKFDISDANTATYVGSGTLDGHIINQFAMDEAASGHLRVASTTTTMNDGGNWWWGPGASTVSQVSVLAQQNGALNVVGKSEPLAEGERIYSARFVGDKGYVVTFRQIDPLFTFDLSDPTNPKKVGELKIPGFSTYMHPLGQTHLLTLGTFIPEDPDASWAERGVQLSIFDVSDMANPKQTFTQLVGNSYAYSEAQYEHKAFNYFAAKKLLAVPFVDWSPTANSPQDYWSSFVTDLRVFEIDTQTGISLKGKVDMSDMFKGQTSYWGWDYYWMPNVRRSVMADDFVYAISDAGIRVANIASLSTPVATIEFDKPVVTP